MAKRTPSLPASTALTAGASWNISVGLRNTSVNPLPRYHEFDQHWLFVDKFLERFFRGEFQRAESRCVHDHADTHPRRRKRNQPKPAIEPAYHPDKSAVDAVRASDVFVMREDGEFLQVIV